MTRLNSLKLVCVVKSKQTCAGCDRTTSAPIKAWLLPCLACYQYSWCRGTRTSSKVSPDCAVVCGSAVVGSFPAHADLPPTPGRALASKTLEYRDAHLCGPTRRTPPERLSNAFGVLFFAGTVRAMLAGVGGERERPVHRP
ncbi:unnamed protein product [Hapterophycus canaliculatus]